MVKSTLAGSGRDLFSIFDSGTFDRGKKYHLKGKVKSIDISNDGRHIMSTVFGRGHNLYAINIDIESNKFSGVDIDGDCSCYVGYNCKHVVAALLKAQEIGYKPLSIFESRQIKPTGAPGLNDANKWMAEFTNSLIDDVSKNEAKAESHHLLYILSTENYGRKNTVDVEVSLKISKLLKKGGYGKPKKYSPTALSQQEYLQPLDEEIIASLQFIKSTTHANYNGDSFVLSGRKSAKLLKDILNTGRCYWNDVTDNPVKYSNKKVKFKWDLLPDGNQIFKAFIGASFVNICVLDELLYVDEGNNSCGIINTDIPKNIIEKLLDAPPMPPETIQKVSKQIKSVVSEHENLLPTKIKKPIEKKGIEPIPEMKLDIVTIRKPDYHQFSFTEYECPVVEISFDYNGKIVPFSFHNTSDSVTYINNNKVYAIKRNFEKEKEYLVGLSEHINVMDLETHKDPNRPAQLEITSMEEDDSFITFVVTTLPHLEYKGWRIVRNHPAFAEVIHDEDIEWYSDLNEESEYDYFEFKMGIVINGEKINILPIISKLMYANNKDIFNGFVDSDTIPLPLPDGKVLAVPFSRIKPIFNTLIEIYDGGEVKQIDTVKLARTRAALLFEIQKAFESAKLRWFGGDKLRKMGEQLAEFKSIKAVDVPKTFKTALRNYQQDGVNWLQFLREYQLNGVLADDMGLGKTVQTLAHLSIEKNKRRMQKPTLIVAPTSLMTNWRLEAEQFAPNLKLLVYHGEDRHSSKSNIKRYDVIVTTYALVLRDKEILLKNEYYYLVLDEAQFIKNRKAKSTQIVHQIKAEHRLCLTGTPMENHLGELWSLFNFLMPGLLGEHLQFKRLFQTPIEKHSDTVKQKMLSNRINPFMLRRHKDEVVKDLPEKTEIIRSVELGDAERDLYESIRLSMEKKVVDVVKKQGLARSHIIILTALLKLRQACCHPKLLKLNSAKKSYKNSAKMELLREMLPNMVEEGRRILLFSQFTSMLELIEEMLREEKINYVKLTGATKNRSKPIESFQKGKVPVFLVSLKAGGTGLNLTAADTVIHYDPWWNPAVEAQATDRAHRIGQKKAVFVYKLIASGTVEETIQEMQQKKKAIIEGLLSEKKNNKLKLSSKDLENLFKPLT